MRTAQYRRPDKAQIKIYFSINEEHPTLEHLRYESTVSVQKVTSQSYNSENERAQILIAQKRARDREKTV